MQVVLERTTFGDALFLLCASLAISPHPLIEYKNFFPLHFCFRFNPPICWSCLTHHWEIAAPAPSKKGRQRGGLSVTRSGKHFACVSDDLCVRILEELWAPLASSAVWLEGFRRKNYHILRPTAIYFLWWCWSNFCGPSEQKIDQIFCKEFCKENKNKNKRTNKKPKQNKKRFKRPQEWKIFPKSSRRALLDCLQAFIVYVTEFSLRTSHHLFCASCNHL